MPGDKRMKDRAQSDWVSETCRNIQVQVIKTTAFNNRLALKESFGMDYSKLFPGSIFNPPGHPSEEEDMKFSEYDGGFKN